MYACYIWAQFLSSIWNIIFASAIQYNTRRPPHIETSAYGMLKFHPVIHLNKKNVGAKKMLVTWPLSILQMR